jgi:Lar family restriction alleviation protein
MTSELKPCPFCGGEADFSLGKKGDGSDWHYVECTELGCGAVGHNPTYADQNLQIRKVLIDAWNTRADLTAIEKGEKE